MNPHFVVGLLSAVGQDEYRFAHVLTFLVLGSGTVMKVESAHALAQHRFHVKATAALPLTQ